MDSLSSIVYSLFQGSPEHGPWVVACLEGAWARLLGEKMAQACRPMAWKNHCLVVEIVDPAWEPTLESLKAEVLKILRQATHNEVRELTFQRPAR